MSRSRRITYDNLRLRDPALVDSVSRHFAEANPHRDPEPPAEERRPARAPIFQPFRLRELRLANRIVVSPMCQYSSRDGMPDDWHLVHLGSRAVGGAGLVFSEATHVSPEGRITPFCAGMYRPEHVPALRALSREIGIPAEGAGRVGGPGAPLSIRLRGGGREFSWPTRELRRIYFDAIPRRMAG